MEVLSLILIAAIKFGCSHSTLPCFSEIGQWLCNFHSSVHTEQLISITEVSQHHNRVALTWLICDNQCKLVQENPRTEPVLFNSAWWLNIAPLHSASAASGCSHAIAQLPAPPHTIPLLSYAAVFSLCWDAHRLYSDPSSCWGWLSQVTTMLWFHQIPSIHTVAVVSQLCPAAGPGACWCSAAFSTTPITPWRRAEGACTLPCVILLLADVSPPFPIIYPKSLPFQIPSFPPALFLSLLLCDLLSRTASLCASLLFQILR